MKHLLNKAKAYIANPQNKEVVAIAAGVAIGVAIVPLTVKCLGATAMGMATKIAIGAAAGTAAGYGTYKAVEQGTAQAMLAAAKERMNNLNN